MNNTIPTAEEFCKSFKPTGKTWQENFHQTMIEFARFHVKKALKAASEQAYVEYVDLETGEIFDYTDVITDDNVGADVNVKSILKAYPLDLIK